MVTPDDLAAWFGAQRRTRVEKEATFRALVDAYGYHATVALWQDGMYLHRRARSMCRAGRDGWTVALRPDDDGKIPCPGRCGDRVPVTPAGNGWSRIEPHRLAATIPTCGVDYEHKVHGHDRTCADCGAVLEVAQ